MSQIPAIALVVVRGGVAEVCEPPHVDVRIVDLDNIEAGDPPVDLPAGIGFEELCKEADLGPEYVDFVASVPKCLQDSPNEKERRFERSMRRAAKKIAVRVCPACASAAEWQFQWCGTQGGDFLMAHLGCSVFACMQVMPRPLGTEETLEEMAHTWNRITRRPTGTACCQRL